MLATLSVVTSYIAGPHERLANFAGVLEQSASSTANSFQLVHPNARDAQ
jgi:hypothetical protein